MYEKEDRFTCSILGEVWHGEDDQKGNPDALGEPRNLVRQKTVREAIEQLSGVFNLNPFRFFREAELHSHLYHLLIADPMVAYESKWGSCPLVRQEYPTPFKCSMGNGRFEVKTDDSPSRRGHYDLVILNPWWMENASREALMGNVFPLFCEEIRDKAQEDDPPFCLVGIEMYLVRDARPTKADYDMILQGYRKLLFSGRLPNGWRFMDHRYMLVYSHYSQPHHSKWEELRQITWEEGVDAENAFIAWTSPGGTRWSA